MWQRRGSYWFLADTSAGDGDTWQQVLHYGPLHLLVDGPVIA